MEQETQFAIPTISEDISHDELRECYKMLLKANFPSLIKPETSDEMHLEDFQKFFMKSYICCIELLKDNSNNLALWNLMQFCDNNYTFIKKVKKRE